MGFFKNLFGNVFDSENVNQNEQSSKNENNVKAKFPEELQLQIVLNMLSVAELLEITKKYELKAHHWNLIANSYKQFQEYYLAEKAYLQAIELDPTNEEPYGNLMALYLTTNNYSNYENLYSAGMANANPRSYIVLKDGLYQYKHKKNYDMAHSAALSVLTAKKMQDEDAFILAVSALFSWGLECENQNEGYDKFMEGIEMLRRGLIVFPNSEHLNTIKSQYAEFFTED